MKNIKTLTLIFLISTLCALPTKVNSQSLGERWRKLKKDTKKEVNEIVDPKLNSNIKSKSVTKKDNQSSVSTDINFDKGIVYKSPNNYISSFEVQSYNGLMRLGDINSYGRYTSRKYDYDKVFNERIKEYKKAQENYFLMVKTKALSDYLKNVEQNVLYKRYATGTTNQERQHKKFQYKLQEHLKKLAFNISTNEAQKKYFANPEHVNPKPTWSIWGGGGSDEFRQMEAYQSFLSENLNDVLSWSESAFLKNGVLEFYVVKAVPLGQYNFEKKGYVFGSVYPEEWLEKRIISEQEILKPFWENGIKPNSSMSYKNRHLIKTRVLKMDASKAKGLKPKLKDYSTYRAGSGKVVFQVIKMRLEKIKKRKILGSEDEYQEQKYNLSYSSPTMEIFADEGLKEKLGETKVYLKQQEVEQIKAEEKEALKEKYDSQKNANVIVNNDIVIPFRSLDVPPQIIGCEALTKEETENCLTELIIDLLAKNSDIDIDTQGVRSRRIFQLGISIQADTSIKFHSRVPITKIENALKSITVSEPGYKDGAKVPTSITLIINVGKIITKRSQG